MFNSLSRSRDSRPFLFDAQEWMRPWTHVCNIARLRAMPAAIPPAVSRFLSVHSIVSGGAVPFVRALNSAITPVLWNSYGASTTVYPEPTSTAVHRPRVDTRNFNGLVLKPQRDIPYDVVAFWGENKVSPLSDQNRTRSCQEEPWWWQGRV